eukprot:15709-Heterococcus_DN1.PRE.2
MSATDCMQSQGLSAPLHNVVLWHRGSNTAQYQQQRNTVMIRPCHYAVYTCVSLSTHYTLGSKKMCFFLYHSLASG